MIRKLILGTASVLALGIGGAALDLGAAADDVPNASRTTPSLLQNSHHWIDAGNLSKDDIRWVQAELHYKGLYGGSLDGVMGPETKRALAAFQKSNGIERTATLDQETADALVGTPGLGQGSSRHFAVSIGVRVGDGPIARKAEPIEHAGQHRGRAPDQFGDAHQLVGARLGQDCDIDRLVHCYLFLDRNAHRNRKFVDSPLEGDGFELPVPVRCATVSLQGRLRQHSRYPRRFCTSTPSRTRAAISASEKPRERNTASPCSLKRGGALRVPPGVRESLIGVPRPR